LKPAGIYKNRLEYLKNLTEILQGEEGHKFYTLEENLNKDKALFLWTIPVETLLLSSYSGPENSKTLYYFKSEESIPEFITEPDLYLMIFFWEKMNINFLNERYFVLPEEPYSYLKAEDLTE
jgi:hypothetical protein